MRDQVFNNETTFTQKAEFLKDVYIYGTLYYDFVGFGTDITVEDINITKQANIADLYVSGVSTFVGASAFQSTVSVQSTISVASTATLADVNVSGALDVDQIDVGIATVRERFELTNEDGTQHLVGFASGPRAGSVGIGSTLPERDLDLNELRVTGNIFDSVNAQGSNGFFLSRDVNGIRWVNATPDGQTDGFFVQNEGVLVGVGSFTTMNLIGTDSGGDLVEATENGTTVNIRIKDHWQKNNQGVHTTVNVGINKVSPEVSLDVDGFALFRQGVGVVGVTTFGNVVRINAPLRVHNNNITGTATTAVYAHNAGVSTVAFAASFTSVTGFATFSNRTGFATVAAAATFAQVAGISTFSNVAFAATFAQTAGIATVANQTGFSTIAGIATFANQSGFSTVSGTATFALKAGIVTFASQAGFATVAGIATFANQSGFSTVSGIATFAKLAGLSTFARQSGFATIAGLATNATRAGIATFIETVQTLTDQEFFIPFVENSVSTGIETVRVDSGIRYNPARDNVIVGGGLTVGGATTIHNALKVDLNADVDGGLLVGGATTIQNTLKVDLGANVGGGLTVGGATTIHNTLKVDSSTVIDGSLELNSTLIDINGSVATGKTDYRLSSVGTGVSWRPPGVETTNILYVTKDGNDSNSGLLEGDAKATIGGAAAVALDGDTIYVRPGTYFENNPIGLRTDVSISGQDLRLVTVVPNNPGEDLFHVRRGCLIENMNFAGNNVATGYTGAMVSFPPLTANQNSGYVAPGPANEGPSGRWRSPYVRNCTNFATDSIGMRVDGDLADAAFTGTNNLGQDLKSMVVDSYTQYNQNGIGVSLTNKGYAQLVSIFTINSKIAIFAGSGGQCDLTNSNSSFGVFGLFADGTSDDEFTGINTGAKLADVDTFQVFGVRDEDAAVRKPFDGQGAFFKINLDDYTDTGTKTGIVTEPLRVIRNIKITNGGSGYSETAPPAVTVSEPFGPEGILAELSANVSAAGTVSSIDVIASGRNFLPAGSGTNQQNISITFSGNGGAAAEAVTDPILFTVDKATEPTTNTGLSTVTFNEFVPYAVGTGVSISFRRLSRIITSSHSFEYVGAGTDINRANPFQGGEPIPENEIVAINGGQIPFTSTDQKGNFRIGQGLVIDQTTSSIAGRDFNRAIQANLTPLILALGG